MSPPKNRISMEELEKVLRVKRDVGSLRDYLRRWGVDLDAICRETCRRVNARRRR